MSYKTNPIANRLKLTKGWKFSSFPSKKKNYAPEVIQGLKIYLALTLFLEFKQLKIAKLEIRKTENNMKIIVLTIYRTKRRKVRKKKKSLTKRDINIKLARTNAKRAINIVYNDIAALKKLSPLRFSFIKKHPFQYKWVSNSKIFSVIKKKRKKLINFLKYKRIKNRLYFKPAEKDLINVESGINWYKPVYFLQKKYKTIWNQARYYKSKGNHLEKISKGKYFGKNFKKTNEYIAYLKAVEEEARKNHVIAARYFGEAAAILYRIKEEHNGLIYKDSTRLLRNKILITRKKKIKYILKNAKISLILLKKNQKYRSFYKKDLLKLVSTKIYKNRNKKKYYFDNYNLSIRSAHLDYHIKAIEYTVNKSITPSENKLLLTQLKLLNKIKKQKKISFFLKLSLFLRKLILKNIRILKKKDGIKLKKNQIKKTKFFINKKNKIYLNKKNKKTTLKLKSFLDVLKNTNFKNKKYITKNKSFDKRLYLKHQRILTKFRLSCIISNVLSKFYSTNTVVKVVNFIESYKNNKLRKKIYSKNKKNKVITVFQKKQIFRGRNFKKNRKKLIKPLKIILEKKIKNSLSLLKLKNNSKTKKEKHIKKFFKKAVKKTYLNKLKTILKRKEALINNPSPWEKSEENIYKRIQQVRAEGLKKNQFLSRFIPVLMVLNKTLNAQILADQIAFEFEKTKNHWPLISSIRSALNVIRFKKLKGFRIGISGKINASSRTRSVFISKGNLPVQTFNERMNFATSQSRARTGTFGIRVWLYY